MLCPLSTLLTAVLKLVVEEMAPLSELLTCESEVLWPLSTLLTAVLRELILLRSLLRLVETPPETLVRDERAVLSTAESLAAMIWLVNPAGATPA